MQLKRRITISGSVLILAVSTGYVMQNADALAARFGAETGTQALAAIPPTAPPAAALPSDPLDRPLAPVSAQVYVPRLPHS